MENGEKDTCKINKKIKEIQTVGNSSVVLLKINFSVLPVGGRCCFGDGKR